jgi:D-alanine-D-alanine ligase
VKRILQVALLAGGDSAEREISLKSGQQCLNALRQAGHRVSWIDPADDPGLNQLIGGPFDVALLALHGGSGENGQIQARLKRIGIPYTGSGSVASARAMSKAISKQFFQAHGVPTPDSALVRAHESRDKILEQVRHIGFPLIVKPDDQGSSLGVGLAKDKLTLFDLIEEAGQFGEGVLLERWIEGREWTVSVLGEQVLAPLEIVGAGTVFDFDAKYAPNQIEYHFSTDLLPIEVERLRRVALDATTALGTDGLVRVDILTDSSNDPWVLEINTLPGMTESSLSPKAAAHEGIGMPELCDWIVREAIERTANDATGSLVENE